MADTKANSQGNEVNAPIFQFRNTISDLARPNLFQVQLYFPGDIGTTPDTGDSSVSGNADASSGESAAAGTLQANGLATMLVKAANIPASTVGVIDVPFRGRTLKIAGDRSFEPWTVTVMNDKNFQLRSMFEVWSTKIQALQQNYQSYENIADYQATAAVYQLNRQQQVVRAYKFEGIWPSNISAIDLAWDSNDTVEEYTVEFQVQYWTYTNDVDLANAPDPDAD